MNYSDFAVKYSECGNACEAAVFAGASPCAARIEGIKALAKREVRKKISALKKRKALCSAEDGLRRIAFGRNNDAVRLAFAMQNESMLEITDKMIDSADLYGVSEIKCGKNGVEMKFFDRQKALELLKSCEDAEKSEFDAKSLIGAIYGSEDNDNSKNRDNEEKGDCDGDDGE